MIAGPSPGRTPQARPKSGSQPNRMFPRHRCSRATLWRYNEGTRFSGGLIMPVHDWTLVEAGIFHGFHTVWIGAINNALNEGLLPKGYYALPEQQVGRPITD